MSELRITEADKSAYAKLPDGWFEEHETYGFRCAGFRLRRLEERGMVERDITGEWPNIESRWRKSERQVQ